MIEFYLAIVFIMGFAWVMVALYLATDYLDDCGLYSSSHPMRKQSARRLWICFLSGPVVVLLWPAALMGGIGWVLYLAGKDALR